MDKIWLLLLGVMLLTGCNQEPSLSFSKIDKGSVNQDVQAFYQDIKEENGVHLYFDNQNEKLFVFLNGSNVVQGEKAMHFTGFDLEEDSGTLKVLYSSEETADYSNSSLDYEAIYRVNIEKEYEVVQLFHNDKEASFATISGSE